MIIVTGCKRSGTSAWMQALQGAGFPVIGKAFPGRWEASIRDANPRGFYECALRRGVWWATNPDPKTGHYLHPGATREHAVKVFVPGLVRTDHAFLHRVIGTMRDWRSYARSLQRLYDLEDAWLDGQIGVPEAEGGLSAQRVTLLRSARGALPFAAEWWFETYDLVRDVAIRRYAFHMLTYDRLLRDPERELRAALGWLGRGDLQGALAAITPGLRSAPDTSDPQDLDAETAALFDEIYEHIDASRALSASFIERMNQMQRTMSERWDASKRRNMEEEGLDTD